MRGSYHTEPAWTEHSILGKIPGEFYNTATPDGDAARWLRAPIGTTQWKKVGAQQVEEYVKVKNDGANDDWVLARGIISQAVDIGDFTDGGSTTGTLALTASIPIGAYVLRSFLVNNTAAATVSTLTIQIGDGTDVDRYSTGTPSVAGAASIISMGAVSGVAVHTAAKTPTLTLTEDSDFGDVTAWTATVVIEYTGSAI